MRQVSPIDAFAKDSTSVTMVAVDGIRKGLGLRVKATNCAEWLNRLA